MHQFGPTADKMLNARSRRIGQIQRLQEKLQVRFNETWEGIFDTFNEFGRDRFIAADGHTLARERREGVAKLDEDGLVNAIYANYPKHVASRILNRISRTKRVIDSEALKREVLEGKIPADLVEQFVKVGNPVDARVRRAWSKEDKQRAQILEIPDPNAKPTRIRLPRKES